jgi:polar amino acid transport system substrate-binding protein
MEFKGNNTQIHFSGIFIYVILLISFFSPLSHANQYKISAPSISKMLPSLESKITESYKKIGIHTEVIHLPAKRALESANNADWVDAELMRVEEASDLLNDYIRIPVPIIQLSISVFSNRSGQEFSTWSSLKPFKVVTLRGFYLIKQRLLKNNVKYFEVDSYNQAVSMLNTNRTDVIIMADKLLSDELKHLLKINGFYKNNIIERVPVYHYVRKRHLPIVPQLTNALKETFAYKPE